MCLQRTSIGLWIWTSQVPLSLRVCREHSLRDFLCLRIWVESLRLTSSISWWAKVLRWQCCSWSWGTLSEDMQERGSHGTWMHNPSDEEGLLSWSILQENDTQMWFSSKPSQGTNHEWISPIPLRDSFPSWICPHLNLSHLILSRGRVLKAQQLESYPWSVSYHLKLHRVHALAQTDVSPQSLNLQSLRTSTLLT
jgi:hypothetical protein